MINIANEYRYLHNNITVLSLTRAISYDFVIDYNIIHYIIINTSDSSINAFVRRRHVYLQIDRSTRDFTCDLHWFISRTFALLLYAYIVHIL